MSLDKAHEALRSAFRARSILEQANGFEVAGDAFEEADAADAAFAVRGWAHTCRHVFRLIAHNNPRAIPIANGMGIVHDEMGPGIDHEMGPPGCGAIEDNEAPQRRSEGEPR